MEFFNPEALSQWLGANPEWILLGIGLIAFVESLAIAGIIVPGVAFLFAAAAAAGAGGVSIYLSLLFAAIGAICGDVISFLIGRHYKTDILSTWPVSNYPEAINKGEAFFDKYGLYSVVIGRFVGPIRPVLPLVAGIMGMSRRKFILVNVLSAAAWAPVYIMPGYYGSEWVFGLF